MLCKKFITLFGLIAFVALIAGCSSSSSDSETTTEPAAEPALISADTLKGWIDNGYMDDNGDAVVILDWSWGSGTSYTDAHIAGAINIGSTANKNRSNGVAEIRGMVWNGSSMDEFIQANGIDENTTLVFTAGGAMMASTRNWWTFSYWGFDANNLKVLDGLVGSVWAAEDLVAGDEPGGAARTAGGGKALSMSSHTLNSSVYATLDEVIAFADGTVSNTAIVDVRSSGEYDGTDNRGNAIAGHIKGAVHIDWAGFLNEDTTYKTSDEIKALLEANGISSGDDVITHCETAVRSGVSAFAVLGILGWSGANYDGAWTEWGNMASAANMGTLPDDSPWRTDNERTENMTANSEAPTNAFTLQNAYAATADAVVLEDMAYGQ